MKKFYALMAASVVCAGTAVAAPNASTKLSAPSLQEANMISFDGIKEMPKKAQKAPRLKPAAKAPVTSAELEGTYVSLADYGAQGYYISCSSKGVTLDLEDFDEGIVYLMDYFYGFLGSIGIQDITADVLYSEEDDLSVISIPSMTMVCIEDGITWYMAFSEYGPTSGFSLYSNDIEFLVTEDGLVFPSDWYYDEKDEEAQFGFALIYEDGTGYRGFPMMEPVLLKSNTVMSCKDYYNNDAYEQAEYPLYTVPVEEDGDQYLLVYNMAGFMEPIFLTLDQANNTAVADQQVLYYTSSDYVIMCTAGDDDKLYAYVDGTIGTDASGNTVISMPETWWAMSNEGWYGKYEDTLLSMNYNIFGNSGISNVANDAAEGEAVYYNLQGMRIANPAAGQVYIKKQGNTVTKVIR